MTADIRTAGAASHAAEGWHTINWKSAYRIVCRLQARIVKAIQEGRWGKVKALQYLLTHSFSGKALAIRRVTENQGKGTPGVDREVWDTPEKKATALQALRQRGYNPQPLRRVYIPKKNGKMRPLGIPTMRDRAMQALYLQALDPIAETMADPNSYGFRKERSTADAIEQCHIVLSNRGGARWIFEGDIKSCFDRISHEWLMAQIPMCKTILQKWLKAGFMEKHVFYATEEGTPQGGICSPVLANMALDGLERELRGRYSVGSGPERQRRSTWSCAVETARLPGNEREVLTHPERLILTHLVLQDSRSGQGRQFRFTPPFGSFGTSSTRESGSSRRSSRRSGNDASGGPKAPRSSARPGRSGSTR